MDRLSFAVTLPAFVTMKAFDQSVARPIFSTMHPLGIFLRKAPDVFLHSTVLPIRGEQKVPSVARQVSLASNQRNAPYTFLGEESGLFRATVP